MHGIFDWIGATLGGGAPSGTSSSTLPSGYDMVADDYLYMDGVSTVVLTDLDDVDTEDVAALQEPVSGQAWEIEVIGSQAQHVVWVLFDATLSSVEPKPAFKITDGDDVWIIKEAKPMTFRTRWKCLCVKQST